MKNKCDKNICDKITCLKWLNCIEVQYDEVKELLIRKGYMIYYKNGCFYVNRNTFKDISCYDYKFHTLQDAKKLYIEMVNNDGF